MKGGLQGFGRNSSYNTNTIQDAMMSDLSLLAAGCMQLCQLCKLKDLQENAPGWYQVQLEKSIAANSIRYLDILRHLV